MTTDGLARNITIETDGAPVKAWVQGVPFDPLAREQVRRMAELPFVHGWVAVMPDVHVGKGATIGSVIPTRGAIVPAAVGVDLGCGMMAIETGIGASRLPDALGPLRSAIEKVVSHGRSGNGGTNDRGAWGDLPDGPARAWASISDEFARICDKHPKIRGSNSANHLGTLGTGNHFVEVCLDERERVWVMLHSGSRGVGNCIGSYFIDKAKEKLSKRGVQLIDRDLAWLEEGDPLFRDYVEAVGWAQSFARINRELMMKATLTAMSRVLGMAIPTLETAVNCHHNYVAREHHAGEDVWVTRKGAVRAGLGELGIIPGSMGAKSFIVRGKGNLDSLCSCSHGAGRAMSRTAAKKAFSVADHALATEGIECRKDEGVIDETPMAYKSIDDVMSAQSDLVDVVHTLKQVLCVKG